MAPPARTATPSPTSPSFPLPMAGGRAQPGNTFRQQRQASAPGPHHDRRCPSPDLEGARPGRVFGLPPRKVSDGPRPGLGLGLGRAHSHPRGSVPSLAGAYGRPYIARGGRFAYRPSARMDAWLAGLEVSVGADVGEDVGSVAAWVGGADGEVAVESGVECEDVAVASFLVDDRVGEAEVGHGSRGEGVTVGAGDGAYRGLDVGEECVDATERREKRAVSTSILCVVLDERGARKMPGSGKRVKDEEESQPGRGTTSLPTLPPAQRLT
ncbi:hypothetical protein BT67DRAFT_58250 [Trichocladium antarcticum]|uniref:Uncharacterized protein n=1 Tax=Trichocladium antarcticum TaxID=1450529 RepID=A0AAN6UI39_9PEZI|nr:hypothetical protein BT67DRAFT_58250 [Trichocladium antarcticum]